MSRSTQIGGRRGLLAPPVDERHLPASLLERFAERWVDGLEACLRFLAPITTRGGYTMAA